LCGGLCWCVFFVFKQSPLVHVISKGHVSPVLIAAGRWL
jgi:hypothetical protein